MVYRIYVEKRPAFANEAASLLSDIRLSLRMPNLTALRILNRYDAENIEKELFDRAVKTVFSEPQVDLTYDTLPDRDGFTVFAAEYLPGQFDQRADSAAQCVGILSQKENPVVRSAKVYYLAGELSREDVEKIKHFIINPVESREASLEPCTSLSVDTEAPKEIERLSGFLALDEKSARDFIRKRGLAMDTDDLLFCRDYFRGEEREPTVTELRILDTYWSDHCRHTTFTTILDKADFVSPLHARAYERYEETRRALCREEKPETLMDIATIAAKKLKRDGFLSKLDESEEINACTVKIKVNIDGEDEDFLLLFKNETHNHPTEIEPFGGAATCIGGAIRDPLSGRSYVYAAMRVTGAADPRRDVSETLPGKLPQRKIVTGAAAGYSSYGNQIGLATGLVDEWYHEGYAAKRLEIGAVIAATPAKNVRREKPLPGDVILLIGGRTGRDGCGGATGSSKSHDTSSLTACGAEVQKGNAPEERKLQRLFRRADAARLIKRCNDFGAGGVSVAIGELADGILVDLDAVPKKYEGLDGTELAISESQERMAVVVSPEDVAAFCAACDEENLEVSAVAVVTEEPRLVLRWNGKVIADLRRDFLDSAGAKKHISVAPQAPEKWQKAPCRSFGDGYLSLVRDLNAASKRGLSERFDSTIGAGTVLFPFGGKYRLTPNQAMVHKISLTSGDTDDCSAMAYGFNPFISEKSPYHGAYLAVIESVAKLCACGMSFEDTYLTFQEYFEKPGHDPARWGQPLAALLGAFDAQLNLKIAAIGGKDSMSGSFEKLDVPPTLVSFAVTTGKIPEVCSSDFKSEKHKVIVLSPAYDEEGLPETESFLVLLSRVHALIADGSVFSAYTPTYGGIAEAVFKMAIGNRVGFRYAPDFAEKNDLFAYRYGSFVLEVKDSLDEGELLGYTTDDERISLGDESLPLSDLLSEYEKASESFFPCRTKEEAKPIEKMPDCSERFAKAPLVRNAKPTVLIPVFPGTNCEYDSAKAVNEAGGDARIFVVRNLRAGAISESVARFSAAARESQMIFIPGGFSAGDEPDGSGKFITAFFRNAEVKNAVSDLLDVRGGLMCGICNGFQALIKLGLVPFGKILDTDEHFPTLTYNKIGRHQSQLVRTRVCSVKSPFLSEANVGDIYTVPISHGEGRFVAEEGLIRSLFENGQVLTQYVDDDGQPSGDIRYNPNGSDFAIEGITSPDGRVLGKMGHSERIGKGLYKNVPGNYDMGLFRSAVKFFKQ